MPDTSTNETAVTGKIIDPVTWKHHETERMKDIEAEHVNDVMQSRRDFSSDSVPARKQVQEISAELADGIRKGAHLAEETSGQQRAAETFTKAFRTGCVPIKANDQENSHLPKKGEEQRQEAAMGFSEPYGSVQFFTNENLSGAETKSGSLEDVASDPVVNMVDNIHFDSPNVWPTTTWYKDAYKSLDPYDVSRLEYDVDSFPYHDNSPNLRATRYPSVSTRASGHLDNSTLSLISKGPGQYYNTERNEKREGRSTHESTLCNDDAEAQSGATTEYFERSNSTGNSAVCAAKKEINEFRSVETTRKEVAKNKDRTKSFTICTGRKVICLISMLLLIFVVAILIGVAVMEYNRNVTSSEKVPGTSLEVPDLVVFDQPEDALADSSDGLTANMRNNSDSVDPAGTTQSVNSTDVILDKESVKFPRGKVAAEQLEHTSGNWTSSTAMEPKDNFTFSGVNLTESAAVLESVNNSRNDAIKHLDNMTDFITPTNEHKESGDASVEASNETAMDSEMNQDFSAPTESVASLSVDVTQDFREETSMHTGLGAGGEQTDVLGDDTTLVTDVPLISDPIFTEENGDNEMGLQSSLTLEFANSAAYAAISNFMGVNFLENVGLPQIMAMRWITADDPKSSIITKMESIDVPRAIQRYSMAAIYYAVTGDNATEALPEDGSGFQWLSTDDECTWKGVSCNKNFSVTAIDLGKMSLSGFIPPEIGFLKSLKTLDFWGNNIVGSLPSSIGLLKELSFLDLTGNRLEGTIPESLYNLTNLQHLYLSNNRLSGSLSTSLGQLLRLKDMRVDKNRLSGRIPDSVRNMKSLRYFVARSNRINGRIPSGFSVLKRLYYFDLGYNRLSGVLPNFGRALNIKLLYLDGNRLTGSIPDTWLQLSGAYEIFVNDNRLTGPVLDLSGFENLVTFKAQNNVFNGFLSGACDLAVIEGGNLVQLEADCRVCACESLCELGPNSSDCIGSDALAEGNNT